MLKKPSASVLSTMTKQQSTAATMEVESTQVHVLADGRKLIDVTMRRLTSGTHTKQEALVVPQFEDDSSSSDDSDSERHPQHRAPVFSSPARRHAHRPHRDDGSDDDDDGEDNNSSQAGNAIGEGGPSSQGSVAPTVFQGEFKWESAGVGDIQQLTNANAQLASQAVEFKRQIKTLQIQLEALVPVPGLSADVVQDILLERDGGVEHDIRDAKIVHQAKTLRQLKRALQREKQLAIDAAKQCKAMEIAKVQLERDVETLTLKAARLQARASAASAASVNAHVPHDPNVSEQASSSAAPTATTSSSGADSSSATAVKRKLDDLKAKHEKLQLDCKRLQRALQREVGDDVTLDEILDGSAEASGKRGRAQQIVMLRAKVKKLESELVKTVSGGGDPSSGSGVSLSSTLVPPTSNNVDARAQQDLTAQHAQRQRLVDKLSAERDELQDKLAQVTKKHDAVKSRAQTLEKEKLESRSKFQLLVDKSRNDDALIDALQKQLETWKAKVHEVKRVRTAESAVNQKDDSRHSMAAELERLRSLVADYKQRQTSSSSSAPSQAAAVTTIGMPAPSEASQFRAMATEKERLHELIKTLQTQLEDKERQLRQAKQQQPLMPSMLPALSEQAVTAQISRIPRKPGMPMLGRGSATASSSSLTPQQQQQTGDDAVSSSELEAMRRAFRESLRAKEDEIATLTNRLHDLQQQQQQTRSLLAPPSSPSSPDALAQDVADLQEENQFLRQEFEKLKTRYEALVRTTKASSKTK